MELLTTERLVLRNFTEEDLESLLDYRNTVVCFDRTAPSALPAAGNGLLR